MVSEPQSQKVRKAVIPAAGLGTRFLPVTRSVPKPLLPVLNTPLIHYAVREAAASGIRDIALVLGPGMEPVADYFSRREVLERKLRERGQNTLLAEQQRISSLATLEVIIQEDPLGLGHAVLLAREFVAGEPFAVILPDDLMWAEPPAIAQLAAVRARFGGSVVAAREVSDDMVSRFGIIDGVPSGNDMYAVRRLVEKPRRQDAPSNLAIVGRYVLDPEVFGRLSSGKPGAGGEIQLTDAIAATIGHSPVHACKVRGNHADAGAPAGMLAAALFEAREDASMRAVVLEAVESWRKLGLA
jgi:UTP--glucose-1-phosphate uridylyltransferase